MYEGRGCQAARRLGARGRIESGGPVTRRSSAVGAGIIPRGQSVVRRAATLFCAPIEQFMLFAALPEVLLTTVWTIWKMTSELCIGWVRAGSRQYSRHANTSAQAKRL